ncbi:2-dehydropantoate 2-reductase [Anaerotignum faecicola]|nr:2-dehydropantoate 2-reductase [Anaerotignum faecicola]
MKIAVIGIGGIGGLVGAALARRHKGIYLIARGEGLKAICENGITLDSEMLGNFTAIPEKVTDDPNEIGIVDALIISTKSYALDEACAMCRPIVGPDTVVLPLLNGINVGKDVRGYINNGDTAEGCIYAFSSKDGPGRTKHIGNMCRIDFGFEDKHENGKAEELARMLNESGITTTFNENIMESAWTKYIMMCGNSCVFTYFDCNAGEVRKDPVKYKFLKDVYTELYNIAGASGVKLSGDVIEKHMRAFDGLPGEAVTSLYRDLKNGSGKTEFKAIIGKAAELAESLGTEATNVIKAYEKNKGR